ncbi:MAG: class II D-tagatose-bisphosphate aldolase, non-catalytic subunit [Anaerolineales bacterium]|nr:class II D-tagatose-bisphosphate aldolase, non-catalytic subunit [Anaerolineales bacterium]
MSNYLDEIVQAQKRGESRGIPSLCTAHPTVLQTAIKRAAKTETPLLIESTCNQVNQFGGYTGMTPANFVAFISRIAEENNLPFERVILGGDHLGPNVWQSENAESAIKKSKRMVHEYVRAGNKKIHLDCSMKLADDDPSCPLDVAVSAQRAAELAKVAEETALNTDSSPKDKGKHELRYVIGTEVPIPGGATEVEEKITVSKIADVRETIAVTREAFFRLGLESAWDRVIAVVVQPGVEFGDSFVQRYNAQKAHKLSLFIQENPQLVYEAHSTDYQNPASLKEMVRDHFAILKVGPALTFAYREAVFALAMMENEFFDEFERSDLIAVLDKVMLENPVHWNKYYQGQESFKRKFSLSDRIRYYWTTPIVQDALKKLFENWTNLTIPLSLLSQYMPREYDKVSAGHMSSHPLELVESAIARVLNDYENAC